MQKTKGKTKRQSNNDDKQAETLSKFARKDNESVVPLAVLHTCCSFIRNSFCTRFVTKALLKLIDQVVHTLKNAGMVIRDHSHHYLCVV